MSWTELGIEIAKQVQDFTELSDVEKIKTVAKTAMDKIYSERSEPAQRKSALDSMNKAIRSLYPTSKEQPSSKNPYHKLYREYGSGEKKGWRHLIFEYLKLSSEDYDAISPARKQHREKQQQKTQEPTTQETITVKNLMNISQLELDTETEKMVEDALNRSKTSLPDFIKKACQVYAKTLVKKAEVSESDLAGVPTKDLLEDKKYQTHPGRAPELTKRAVIAIKKHNASVPETEDRWHITQSAITRLTGSRPAAVAKALEQFQDDIREMEDLGLNAYSNRKGKDLEGNTREIEKEINLVELVPDGYTD
ncbi:hypothetical protein G7B40_041225 [Aetokthonos hydrillicola Thurmond2011]|jgi:hypothetical protein|uniref:Uncharacterized protein n=1 Tax=Aetokthonos hydrillicola Thurmond2011 TaxID=2712845 RepID=A0AAP5IFZ5_9CYAN|nr:hypothetical protein [Aetokthonos hydrillicola]MBW4591146.1 hypothetical protein [Aetokthonos hydrillicola CCALA 1050]MDR9900910.1 hypothetical protein [Aetokthonos hydrillicola Thurmond2011]